MEDQQKKVNDALQKLIDVIKKDIEKKKANDKQLYFFNKKTK